MTSTGRGGPAPPSPIGPVALGEVVARKYRILRFLGAGGMGTVYAARHRQLDVEVAIKFMRVGEDLDESVAERRFLREARAAATLRSPHAVRVLDSDRLPSGVPYLVMEFLDGRNLERVVDEEGPIPIHHVVEYGIAMCDALAEAHGRGIIHRDVKPQNVFLTTDGVIKVFDFGIAKPLRVSEGDTRVTGDHVLLGSLFYMSPEQLRSPSAVDARTDIWSMGATLYHLVAGEPPFFGAAEYVVATQILKDDPVPLGRRRAGVPDALAALVAQCLQRRAEARPSTFVEVAERLLDIARVMDAASSVSTERPPPGSAPDSDAPSTSRAPVATAGPLADEALPREIVSEPHLAVSSEGPTLGSALDGPPSASIRVDSAPPRLYEDTPDDQRGTALMPATPPRSTMRMAPAAPSLPAALPRSTVRMAPSSSQAEPARDAEGTADARNALAGRDGRDQSAVRSGSRGRLSTPTASRGAWIAFAVTFAVAAVVAAASALLALR